MAAVCQFLPADDLEDNGIPMMAPVFRLQDGQEGVLKVWASSYFPLVYFGIDSLSVFWVAFLISLLTILKNKISLNFPNLNFIPSNLPF